MNINQSKPPSSCATYRRICAQPSVPAELVVVVHGHEAQAARHVETDQHGEPHGLEGLAHLLVVGRHLARGVQHKPPVPVGQHAAVALPQWCLGTKLGDLPVAAVVVLGEDKLTATAHREGGDHFAVLRLKRRATSITTHIHTMH